MKRKPKTNHTLTIRCVLLMGVSLVVLIINPLRVRADEPVPTPKRILFLYHYGREAKAVGLLERGFDSVIEAAASTTSLELYREVLEIYRFTGESHQKLMRDYLKEKYAGRKIDVVVVHTDTALDFFLRYRDEIMPGVPVVYLTTRRPEVTAAASTTGIWVGPSIKDTLEVALQLQPATQNVFVISGGGSNQSVELEAKEQLREFENHVRLTYLSGRALEEIIATVKQLPERSVIISQRQNQGIGGRGITPIGAAAMIAQAANVPVYSSVDAQIGEGVVGGKVISHEELGKRLAQMALQISNGTKPEEIPVEKAELVPMFDWRQLKRWGINERRLPPGSLVLFKESTFWEQYKWRIIGAMVLVVCQAALITILLFERKKRQRANELLNERLQFETLLSKLSAEFTDLPTSKVEPTIVKWVEDLKTFLKVDSIEFVDVSNNGDAVQHKFSLVQSAQEGEGSVVLPGSALAQLQRGETINYPSLPIPKLPDERKDSDHNFKSLLAIPIAIDGTKCALMFSTWTRYRQWPTDLIPRLRLISEIFANALDREHSAAELQRARTDLAHVGRVTAMGEMAASIAHEVNQPLSAIATYGDACVRLLSADSPNVDKSLEAIRHIISDSLRASEVLKRIRSLVKKTDRDNAPLDLNEVIQEVIALTDSDLRQNQIQLRLELDEDLRPVSGDRVELQQVVLNLVLNSIEALQTITDRTRKITIASCVNSAGEVEVQVSDSGIGLPKDFRQRIFEHFVSTKPNGLGMGLSISRTIIGTHNGKLWAEPNSPHGATFLFSLPTKELTSNG